jgi:hypothetical protein
MPKFRFQYTSPKMLVPDRHAFTATDLRDALLQKDIFIAENGGTYVFGSMEEFQQTTWQNVRKASKGSTSWRHAAKTAATFTNP